MQSIGLFTGIGAIELGLQRMGIEPALLCEVDATAQAVVKRHFGNRRLVPNVKDLRAIPKVQILTAGFPCQDLSQAGQRQGLNGASSSLVTELFRLLHRRATRPDWVVLENVPFMLQLHRGHAMTFITRALERLGYWWAYRIIDTRAFGIPQRRRRVFIVASLKDDPRPVLFGSDFHMTEPANGASHGFYWTEGNTGIGWAVNAIPALKAGSTISIPSPPAVWLPATGRIFTPDIRDAERLQGLPINWTRTQSREDQARRRIRWRLVGNAVSVPVAEWIGRRIKNPGRTYWAWEELLRKRDPWPTAAWGGGGYRYKISSSEFPVQYSPQPLHEFLRFEGKPLSFRAAAGVLKRLKNSSLHIRGEFLRDLAKHANAMRRLEERAIG